MAKRIQPRLAKGMRDQLGAPIRRRNRMIETVRAVFERFGFQALETPVIEHREVLTGAKAGETSSRIYQWHLEEEDVGLGLRFDLTVPLARFVAANRDLRRPFKRYQVGPVFRVDKPGAGRFREFYQFDIDIVGTRSMLADAEIVLAMGESLKALGLPEFTLRWNHRGILNAALRRAGVGDALATAVIRVIDKEDKIGPEGVRAELGPGRVDAESAAPIDGLNLPEKQIASLEDFLTLEADDEAGRMAAVRDLLGDVDGAEAVLKEAEALLRNVEAMGGDLSRTRFAPRLARGMDYYTGPIFEASLDSLPEFGSIMGGGRYDELVSRFSGDSVPGTGASIGVDRLLAALETLEGDHVRRSGSDVLVTILDPGLLTEYQGLVRELRAAGLNAEIYLKEKARLGDQLRYASDWSIPFAVILGEDEVKARKVTIKDLVEGRAASQVIADRSQWVEERPGQFSLDRDRLVTTLLDLVGTR